ncbi:hypothetical protein [Pseudomonas sp. NPDC088444]|uniref:hypothetical protein n=1 Tax=Pseudomonas sp. NPDC088444 TaxID=3364456 RepID=UPI00384A89DF
MEDEKDIPPSAHPQKNKSESPPESTENKVMDNSHEQDDSDQKEWSVPHYEEFQAGRTTCSTREQIPAEYSPGLSNILDIAAHLDEELKAANPTLAAPYLDGHESGVLTQEELIAGVYVNVPRSARIWTGDYLKMRWGSNCFCTVLTVPEERDGPRLTQYVCLDRLAKYETGKIAVRYEVVRRARLVGVSETLIIMVRGSKTRPKWSNRGRAIRRRRL